MYCTQTRNIHQEYSAEEYGNLLILKNLSKIEGDIALHPLKSTYNKWRK